MGLLLTLLWQVAFAASEPTRAAHGMVVSADTFASSVGVEVLQEGGNAVDAAIATAFTLAVTHPTGGNIGGGGFLIHQPRAGKPIAYDFRESAPAASHPGMWLDDGEYNFQRHHLSHMSVGVPGTVAGLYMAWQDSGSLPWEKLVAPAIALARDGFVISDGLARSLRNGLQRMRKYPASMAQFSNDGVAFVAGEILRQADLADSLSRIAKDGPAGFYQGPTADFIVAEMRANGGLITHDDLANYRAHRREPVQGDYRGYRIVSMPPPSSGGTTLLEMLNILEAYDIASLGFGSTATLHLMIESMRRAYADRARYLGDPEFNDNPVSRLISKSYARDLRLTIRLDQASVSSATDFAWPAESEETTHFSVVDKDRNAVSLTYTLEYGYGSAIVVPGAGFLLNNEMGDFNAGPGLTNANGLIGTPANLAEPGKRMLSSMSPTIVTRNGELFMVTGTPGGRTIINTVLQTLLNVIDHGMNAQAAVDAGRIHHQWLPDKFYYERQSFSPDSIRLLEKLGHIAVERKVQGSAQVIVVNADERSLEGGQDRRHADSAAVGY